MAAPLIQRVARHSIGRQEGLQPGDPYCSHSRIRISKHCVRFAFRTWKVKAGFDRLYPFYALRHTAVTKSTGPAGTSSWRRRLLGT